MVRLFEFINKNARVLSLALICFFPSCKNRNQPDVPLHGIAITSKLIHKSQLNDTIGDGLKFFSGYLEDQKLNIYLTDVQNNKLFEFAYDFDSLKVSNNLLYFLSNDRVKYYSTNYSPGSKKNLLIRNQKNAAYDYNEVFYLLNNGEHTSVKLDYNPRFSNGKDLDSNKYRLYHKIQKPAIQNNTVFVEVMPTLISYSSEVHRKRFDIPDLLSIDISDGSIKDIKNSLNFNNLEANGDVYLTSHSEKNRLLLTYSNDLRFWFYDIRNDTTLLKDPLAQPYLKELDSILFKPLENIEVVLLDPKKIYIENKVYFIRHLLIENNTGVSSANQKRIFNESRSYLVYDSDYKLVSFFPSMENNFHHILGIEGMNYLPEISGDNVFTLKSVTFNLSEQKLENIDDKIDSLLQWVGSFEGIVPLDFTSYSFGKEATVVLMPKKGCPTCVTSSLNALLENKDILRDDVVVLYSKAALAIFGINLSEDEALPSNFICLPDAEHQDLLPKEMDSFRVYQLKDGKVESQEEFMVVNQICNLQVE